VESIDEASSKNELIDLRFPISQVF
jgi:hypothetical protein